MTFIEGPVLKKRHLATLEFETAGHSAGQAHDMRLTSIVDAHELRNRIIEAREAIRQPQQSSATAHDPQFAILTRISAQLDELATLLRAGR